MELQIENYKDKHEYISENGIRSVVYLMDCIEGLKQIPDKYFELAIVDPPYGIGAGGKSFMNGTTKNKRAESFYKDNDWDKNTPPRGYFEQLKRVSKKYIIWGGNYYVNYLSPARCFIVWDKKTGNNSYADCELALTNIDSNAKIFVKLWLGAHAQELDGRIHPTQKPIALYEWIIKNYAKDSDKILDTHLGSGSSRIAAHKANLPFMGFELDEDYFKASVKRFEQYVSQKRLF